MSRIGKRSQVIEIDGSGVIVQEPFEMVGLIAIASADSPQCIIEDIDGVIIYELKDSSTNKRYYPLPLAAPVELTRINVTTWVNMERVIIYRK